MSNIPISQVVQINPRVIGAGGAQGSLDGLFLTQDDAVAPSRQLVFYSAADVSKFFGPTSDEAATAGVYFAGIIGGGQQPQSLTFARYALADAPAEVLGASFNGGLPDLQALSGTLSVTTAAPHTSSNIDLSAATSFANAATIMMAGFTTPDFLISWDATRRRFIVSTNAVGDVAAISAVTGTLAAPVGLSADAGAQLQAAGVAADTPATAMDRVVASTVNWYAFSTVWFADIASRFLFAEWNAARQFQFSYLGWDEDVQALTPDNPTCWGAMVRNVPYEGTLALRGNVRHAAAVMSWAASTNFQIVNGRNTLAFRRPVAVVEPRIDTLAAANALLSNGYTYLGDYASTANTYTVFYNGAIGGQFEWSDTYLGQVWLRRTLQQALFETLQAYNTLPYNTEGYNAIYQGAQDTISQATQNGVIRAGVTLSASQRAQINAQAGADIATEVADRGWFLQVTEPLSTSVRTERGSPVVNLWYCDGGSIQKIVVSSTTVL